MDPDDAVTHSLLSQAYHRLGRDDEARREMELAAQIHGAQQPAQGENK
jgi:Flp pilus assembly protein TadD